MTLAKAGFILSIRPVSTLRPHEQTIPAHVKRIASDILRDGVQKDPIIIDRESSTVLDGMHRLAAFVSLRIENAVCCSVEYSSRAVTLGRWARVYTVARGDSSRAVLGSVGITRRTTLAEAFEALESRDAGLAVLTSDSAYLPEERMDLGQAMAVMSSFDSLSEEKGWERRFVPEDDIDLELQERRKFVLLPRKLMKDDVVAAARSGKLLP
ncbi:MAG: ParB N-terminal domain-containing protein, partial [Nitrososphaerota archaeon]|nr:ParB N-terminal domain-containing protein [Nitrososphaerota archaeon]